MSGTKKERFAQAARKAAAVTFDIDFDKFELTAKKDSTTVRLPLSVTVEQGAEFSAIVEQDNMLGFLDLLAQWGYEKTSEAMRSWPTFAVIATIRHWLETIEEAQGAVLGES